METNNHAEDEKSQWFVPSSRNSSDNDDENEGLDTEKWFES